MKQFTCKEIYGPCDEVFEGATYNEVAEKCGKHIMSSTDEAHKRTQEKMANSAEEDQSKWFAWFKGEWDKKAEADVTV